LPATAAAATCVYLPAAAASHQQHVLSKASL
jgi:hypothetical protein